MLSITLQPNIDSHILFVGGGAVAERRIGLCIHEACCIVISPVVTDQIRRWSEMGLITWHKSIFKDVHIEILKSSRLVFICTNHTAINDDLESLARRYKVLLNLSDNHLACDFTVPSTLNIGDVHISIGANNAGPRVNRLIRQDMTKRYSELKIVMPRLKIIREEVKLLIPRVDERQQFWRTHLDEIAFQAILDGDWPLIEEKLHHAISGIRPKS